MSKHSKTAGKPLMVRISPEQRRRLEKAAAIETRRRGETVDLSQLLRELAMAEIDRIITEAAPPQLVGSV
jgi:hypothetical protein